MKYAFLKVSTLSLILLLSAFTAALAKESMLVEVTSPYGVEETFDKLKAKAKSFGWKAPKSWKKNFQKNLKKVTKTDIGKAIVLEMCEPKVAAKLLVHDQYKMFLAMMPCSIAVYEKSDGKTYVSMMNMRMLSQMFEGAELQEMVDALAPQMDEMLKFD